MKASAIAYGGILLILIITSLITAYIVGGAEPVNRNVVTLEGGLMSFADYENLLLKTFDESVSFISQRAAYDLGMAGGIDGREVAVWNSTYPPMEVLEQQLGKRIGENLPHGTTEGDRTVFWGNSSVDVSGYDNNLGSNANYYMHVEIGYKDSSTGAPCLGQISSNGFGTYCIPNPEYSNPSNNANLDKVENSIQAGVEENALTEVANILKSKGANVVFDVFPYYAEKHPTVIKQLLSQGFTIGIHMHEDWKQLTSMSLTDLTNYIKSEKTRLENAIGSTVTIFSYGPGIQLDDMYGKETPPDYGSLSDDEKRKMFQAVLNAGFDEIQTASDYKDHGLLPSGLSLLDSGTGLPHSWELHTSYGTDRNACGPIENSKCFIVEVNKSFLLYDKSIDSRISLNPYTINLKISSSYFKLLTAGRAIFEDSNFNTLFNDVGALLNQLYAAKKSGDPRFINLDFDLKPILTAGESDTSLVDPSLVGYWNFDEGSGNTANDYSGNGNNGILGDNACTPGTGNCPSWVGGIYGSALQFNGINNYVEIPDSPSLRASNNQITVEMWVKRNQIPAAIGSLINKESSIGGRYNCTYCLLVPSDVSFPPLTESDSKFFFETSSMMTPVSFGLITDYNWHHLAVTYDGNALKSYVDGNLYSTKTPGGNMPLTDASVKIGGDTIRGSYFNGAIDEVKIYNRPLSEDEIKKEYSSQNSKANLFEMTIVEKCYPNTYCLAPLKAGETAEEDWLSSIGKDIRYDYLRLKFKIAAAVGSTAMNFDFDIHTTESPSVNQGGSIRQAVQIIRLGALVKPVSISYSITPNEPTISISLTSSSGNPTFASDMEINTASNTPIGTYTVNVVGTGGGLTRQTSFTLIVKNTCSDGTVFGQCSSTKPKYCSSGTLINACSQCGCPTGQTCNSATGSCYTPPSTCSDGTAYGSCSATKPKYCDNGNLINKCSQCGCSSGTCQSDGSCSVGGGGTPSTCDSTCKSQNFATGTCEAGGISGNNLGVIPDAWGGYTTYGDVMYMPSSCYPNCPQITHVDNSVLHNGHVSIRIDHHVDGVDPNGAREVDGKWLAVKPGDHVVFKCWIKTSPQAAGYANDLGYPWGSGGRLGIDFYDSKRIGAIESNPNGIAPVITGKNWETTQAERNNYVLWGSDWTSRVIDLIIPQHVGADGAPYPNGEQHTPYGIIPWLQAWGNEPATGVSWFSDCELYINPTSSSTSTCQSGESSIGQDGCSSNNLCCCSGTATCSCGAWTNGACGGSCPSGQRQQTRTCNPSGCTPTDGLGTSRCVADSSCAPSTCDSTCKAQSFSSGTCEAGTSSMYRGMQTGYPMLTLSDVQNIQNHGGTIIEVDGCSLAAFLPSANTVNTARFTTTFDVWAGWAQSQQIPFIFTFNDLTDPWGTVPNWMYHGGNQVQLEQGYWDVNNHVYDDVRSSIKLLWQTIASRYKGNPYLIFDFVNEPFYGNNTVLVTPSNYRTLESQYSNGITSLVDAVITIDSTRLILVDAPFMVFEDMQHGTIPIDIPRNIIWEAHAYVDPTWTPNLATWEHTYIDAFVRFYVTNLGKPLYIGEYGYFDNNNMELDNYPNWQSILSGEVAYLKTLPLWGYQWNSLPWLSGGLWNSQHIGAGAYTASESAWILNTVLGGSSTTTNTNLAVIPNDWGGYLTFGDVKYDGDPQITHVETNQAYWHSGHPSIRIDAHQQGVDSNHWREIDWANGSAYSIPVKAGDHIVFKMWIKTGHSTLGQDGVSGNGGILAFDYYSSHRLHEKSTNNPYQDTANAIQWETYRDDPAWYVPYNSDWTLRTLDVIVPVKVYDDTTGQIVSNAITAIIPCPMASGYIVTVNGVPYQQDEGQVWFADAQLYINPTSGSSSTATCQSGESSIGQDGCSSNNLCCCLPKITCTSCGSWTNGACGASGCSSTQRQQTRTCNPSGCTPTDGLGTTRCVADSSCAPSTCDSTCKLQNFSSGSCRAGTTTNILLGVGHPSWSYKPDGSLVDIQALVNLVASKGANCWRESFGVSADPTSQYYSSLKSYCDAAGLKFEIQTLSASVSVMTYQQETNIIEGVGSAQTDWINGWSNIIQHIQPYAIMVMNEPTNNGAFTTATSQEFSYYRQFCINAITAWRKIKPDLVIIVQNDPFNDEFDSTTYGFAANPLPYSNIIYSRHEYYAYDDTYPPNYKPEQQAYWNATTSGQLAVAKQLLTQHIEAESSALRNEGQQVMWDEFGANLQAPHATNYVQDFFDICKSLNIGAVEYDIVPWGYGSRQEPAGLLNNDYTLNALGQVWAANMPGKGSTSTCQSGESSIGQDGCSSNNLCCCSGTAQTCSSLTYPTDKWQRVWYTHSTGACLGNGPDETSTTFDDNWASGTVAYQADDIQFNSSRTINLPAGTYTFTLGSDDGARLWIDDVLRIDKWVDRSYTTDSVTLSMTAGNHKFRIDWYENTGAARTSFNYSQAVTSQNLAVIPNNCEGYLQYGRIVHHADPQVVFLDTSVTYNGFPSIRCDGPATSTNPWREVDFYNTSNGPYSIFKVKPGDHVVFKIWMKTAHSTTGLDNDPRHGAMLGIDLYGSTRIWEVAWGYPAATDFNTMNYSAYKYVPYNTPTWTQGTIDFIVPSKQFTKDSENVALSPSPQTVTGMIPWIYMSPSYSSPESGQGWFSDPELYINP